MKQLIVLLALIAVSSGTIWIPGFRIRFDVGADIGGSFFYDIPRTLTDAVSEGWTQQTQAAGLPVTSVSMYCYSDLIVCCFYDDDGDVAGMQIALPQDGLVPYYDNMEASGYTLWTIGDRSYWTIQQYFTTEETLSNIRLGRANENKIIENGSVWVVGVNKEVLHIANSTSEIVSSGVFTLQACVPWMGRHYYYKMTPSTSCMVEHEPLYPWFPIVDSGQLIATAFGFFGKLNLDSSARNWFESPDRAAVETANPVSGKLCPTRHDVICRYTMAYYLLSAWRLGHSFLLTNSAMIVPNGPTCMYELADNPGLTTMHIFYVDQPWLVSCIDQQTIVSTPDSP